MSELTPATQLAILLTARWSINGAKPLTNSEFLEVRRWLGPSQEAARSLLMGQTAVAEGPVDPDRFQSLLHRGLGVFQSIDKWLSAGLWVVSWAEQGYPSRFKQLKHRAPVLLFGYGDPNAFSGRALAIVGSRNATAERLSKAAEVGRACSSFGITVVSGGARGVDAAAMEAGMVGKGTVVGVLADSLLRESGKKSYRDAIMEGRMCLMSEVHPEASFDVGNAMARNRLAYACADATLVIECDPNKGGTWAGAIEALREGKAVYVLKGARAERLLREKGGIPVDIDFALQPDKLLVGIRPPVIAPSEPNAVMAFIRSILDSPVTAPSDLAKVFRSEADRLAAELIEAAVADGLIQASPAPAEPVLTAKKSRRKNKAKPVSSLFENEAETTRGAQTALQDQACG